MDEKPITRTRLLRTDEQTHRFLKTTAAHRDVSVRQLFSEIVSRYRAWQKVFLELKQMPLNGVYGFEIDGEHMTFKKIDLNEEEIK